MSEHPLNLAARFILEIIALIIFSQWGWHQGGVMRYVLSVSLPVTAMIIWAVFRVPGDPGKAPVAINGKARLLLELVFFSLAILALPDLNHQTSALLYATVLVIHYMISAGRIRKLWKTSAQG